MYAYNLFRHSDKQDLVCAVPEDCAVPGFIADRTWDFERKLMEPATAPRGFDASAATDGVRLNGFYLFQSFEEQTINIRQ
jgi:hypothetical protein